MKDEFAAHIETLLSCRACPNVGGSPVTGAVKGARILLVGQAPGPREVVDKRPFAFTAGRRLFGWFEQHLGITEEEFRAGVYIGAVIRCFPGRDPKKGGDRVPDSDEIGRCSAHLDREIRLLSPELVIAVGTLASKQLIGEGELKQVVGRLHRIERAGRKLDLVVLPHPSGRSTWMNIPANAQLLERSLSLIGRHPAWTRTFASSKLRDHEKDGDEGKKPGPASNRRTLPNISAAGCSCG